MDHIIILDSQSNELDKLLSGKKTMLIRGSDNDILPCEDLQKNDVLYLLTDNEKKNIKATAILSTILMLPRQNKSGLKRLISNFQGQLQLNEKQFEKWSNKKDVVLIELVNTVPTPNFKININITKYNDSWFSISNIEDIKIT